MARKIRDFFFFFFHKSVFVSAGSLGLFLFFLVFISTLCLLLQCLNASTVVLQCCIRCKKMTVSLSSVLLSKWQMMLICVEHLMHGRASQSGSANEFLSFLLLCHTYYPTRVSWTWDAVCTHIVLCGFQRHLGTYIFGWLALIYCADVGLLWLALHSVVAAGQFVYGILHWLCIDYAATIQNDQWSKIFNWPSVLRL